MCKFHDCGTEMLYHYCSLNSFMSIVQNKCFWLCDATKSNDTLETKVIEKYVQEYFDDKIKMEPSKQKYYEKELKKYNDIGIVPYIISFSDSTDIVTQWRLYADDAKGMAIGFEKCDINIPEFASPFLDNKENRYALRKVKYITKDDLYIIMSEDSIDEIKELILYDCKDNTKVKAFQEEHETRIIYYPLYRLNNKKDGYEIESLFNMRFRNANGRLSSYYEMPIDKIKLSQIIIGPRNETTVDDVKKFLKVNGYEYDINVYKSELSYRP